jgi:hypothetical protein
MKIVPKIALTAAAFASALTCASVALRDYTRAPFTVDSVEQIDIAQTAFAVSQIFDTVTGNARPMNEMTNGKTLSQSCRSILVYQRAEAAYPETDLIRRGSAWIFPQKEIPPITDQDIVACANKNFKREQKLSVLFMSAFGGFFLLGAFMIVSPSTQGPARHSRTAPGSTPTAKV